MTTIGTRRRLQFRLRLLAGLALILLAVLAPDASAQSANTTSSLRRQIFKALNVGSYEDAVQLIGLYLDQAPNDPTMLYNAACAHCRLREYDEAASYLYRAMKAGFRDFEQLREDSDLQPLRTHPTYKKIFDTLDARDEKRSYDALGQWRTTFNSEAYRYETDKQRRLQFATALDETADREMRQMLERESDQLVGTLFGAAPPYFVLIAVPTPADADTYFKGDDAIGGIYQHSKHTLVARNIGGSLRHEFFHAMHYGDMERLDQLHRLWIQEGLASLYENYELDDDGAITFLPNERHNITRARARAGRLLRWRDLFEMSSDDFMNRATALYPQVRSMFRFVADRGLLVAWYRNYTRNFGTDPTGRLAFELTFDQSVNEIERDWRKWVVAQPPLDLEIGIGDAALGIRSGRTGRNTSNDGVQITDVLPGSAAEAVGLRKGDVIVAADGQDTRSMRELQACIGAKKVGQRVELRIRRGEEYFTVTARLKPMVAGY